MRKILNLKFICTSKRWKEQARVIKWHHLTVGLCCYPQFGVSAWAPVSTALILPLAVITTKGLYWIEPICVFLIIKVINKVK